MLEPDRCGCEVYRSVLPHDGRREGACMCMAANGEEASIVDVPLVRAIDVFGLEMTLER